MNLPFPFRRERQLSDLLTSSGRSTSQDDGSDR